MDLFKKKKQDVVGIIIPPAIAVVDTLTNPVSSPIWRSFVFFLDRIKIVTNVTFFINKIVNHPIGCVDMTSLPKYIKKNKAVIGLEREPIHHKRYNDNLCLFRCIALHRGGDRYHLESAVTKLYETYKQDDDVPMEEFVGITLEDLYRVETTFQTNVCVYKLVESDDADGKKTAELVRRSLCHYSDTMYLNLHETHFSYIQNIQM